MNLGAARADRIVLGILRAQQVRATSPSDHIPLGGVVLLVSEIEVSEGPEPARFLLLQQPLAPHRGEARDSRSSAPWCELFPLICSVHRLPCLVTRRRQLVCLRALALPGSNFVS